MPTAEYYDDFTGLKLCDPLSDSIWLANGIFGLNHKFPEARARSGLKIVGKWMPLCVACIRVHPQFIGERLRFPYSRYKEGPS